MKVDISIYTNKIGSQQTKMIEIDDEDFKGMDEQEKQTHIEETCYDYVISNMLQWDYKIK